MIQIHSLLTSGELPQKIDTNAREMRLAKNLSRKSLAKRTGISESTIKRFESNGQVSLDALALIATALAAKRQIAELFKHERPVSLEEIKQTGRTRGRQ
ncbi:MULTISPECIES: helix-turn-helix domain-containing protein [Pseudomonadaceae]|uniref:XRE family transcriptional regulator n=1 Tax=Pseudomonas jilinensis TaxID=2078689 RepID=A0A396RWT0_9PSED|nr:MULTISPECIES: helix-turn-helix transcriptional regulator [Pseudomonadaceae]RAA00521.1 XRE family transcriptional regulator [Stutzerimonas stutzeri]RHW21044.1 XRE family transcriptional regulator [Pseudomonas jilinensis]TGY09887.1 XRE family transcriptional regulator [Stutzerimonas stutzeri]